MKYLAVAMDRALEIVNQEIVNQEIENQERRIARENSERLAQENADQEQREFDELSKRQEEAFLKSFPEKNEQISAVNQFIPNLAGLSPEGTIARRLAISAWWNTKTQTGMEN